MPEPTDPSNQPSGPSFADKEAGSPRDSGAVATQESSQAATKTPKQDFSPLLTLLLAAFLGSVVISLYVLGVNVFRANRQEVDAIGEAALKAAHRLSYITIEHSSFGRVGLCDLERLPGSMEAGGAQVRVVGIHSLHKTLQTDEVIAKRLKHPIILKLVKQDLHLAHKVEDELVQRLRQAVEPDSVQTTEGSNFLNNSSTVDQDNSIYRDLHRLVATGHRDANTSLTEMHIRLGKIKHPVLITSQQMRLVEPEEFEPVAPGQAPNLVLVEASYEGNTKDGSTGTVIKKACAVIAAELPERRPSAFVISFPDGVPPQFRKASDILFCKEWPGRGGWQQAVGSEVPGRGSLAPPLEPVLPEMNPGDAMAVALYHWLRDAGPLVDAARFEQLMATKWEVDTKRVYGQANVFFGNHNQETQIPVNSCLARDTGAREYAVMNQTGPGGVGQLALAHALGVYNSIASQQKQTIYPATALPLLVDAEGKLNLSGRDGFKQELVKDYLDQVYQTNIAAIESLSCAQALTRQSSSAISQIEQRVFIEKQELASLANRPDHNRTAPVKKEAGNGEQAPQPHLTELTNERMETLRKAIASDEEQRKTYSKIQRLCLLVTNNSNRVAAATYELCTHSFKLCRDGLFRVDEPLKGYLVGKTYVFVPRMQPMTESDFYAAAKSKQFDDNPAGELSAQESAEFPWLSRKLDAVLSVETAFAGKNADAIVEGRPLKDVLEEKPTVKLSPGTLVVLSSDQLVATSSNGATAAPVYGQYPFFNIPIPSGQLFYYCQNAALTGAAPKVSWSMLIRDLVASKNTTAGEVATGEPAVSQDHDWCGNKQRGQGRDCPGLACEMQIRTPLPVLDQWTTDSYLTSPTANVRAPQIPPVPPDML